jgi:hypothetical protein
LPVVFALVSAGIVANQLASNPAEALIGLLVVLIGLPVYRAGARRRAAGPTGGG